MARPRKEVSLRLNEMESFLKDNTLSDPDFEQAVKEKTAHNQKVLSEPTIPVGAIIFRNFEVEFDTKTLQIIKHSFTEQEAEVILRNFDKKELMMEVC